MSLDNRDYLPLRKNCEGYFIDDNHNILARDSGKGHLIFPGGGLDQNESLEEGMLREAYEETGVLIIGKLKKLGVLQIIWGNNWAKTEKQRKRYKKYKGDKMHFFFSKIKKIDDNHSFEDAWQGKKLMKLKKAITILESSKPFQKDVAEYYNLQLKFLKSFYGH